MGKPAPEKTTLCVECRATFSPEQIVGATACPNCGTKGLPADLQKKATVELTEHEWRILCIWASNWAAQRGKNDQPGYDSPGCANAIIREIHRQAPTLGGLSMGEDLQELANAFGNEVKIVDDEGNTKTLIRPETKH